MGEFQIFGLISGLLLLAFGANRLFRVTRIPDLVVLMVMGLVLGPTLKWVNPDQFRAFTQILGSLALILILFEGGMELNLREGIQHFPGGVVLAFLGYGLAFGAVAAAAHWSFWLPWRSAVLLGGVFGCTSSTVVMPVLQQLRVRAPVRVTLLLESALGDVIAVLTVSSLLNTSTGVAKFSGFMSGFLLDAGIASGMGALAGILWWWLWPRLAPQKFSNTVAFGAVLGIYAVTHAVGGSGLLAVLAFGLILGNLPNRGDIAARELQFLSFHSELSFLVRSFFFVLLGVIVEFVGKAYILPILAILGALLVSRFLAVQVSRIALRGISSMERELLLLMMPRGLITAVLAVQVVQARGEEFSFLPAMAFTTILATNLLMVASSIRTRPEAVLEQPPVTHGSSESPSG
ncbi:MAG TPA: cation:proton antiporter [Candidatus Sulfotelmatobacter sp.]|nr:cation:proton antiporter [Candidatus Sulfotelmatobacter sp.]